MTMHDSSRRTKKKKKIDTRRRMVCPSYISSSFVCWCLVMWPAEGPYHTAGSCCCLCFRMGAIQQAFNEAAEREPGELTGCPPSLWRWEPHPQDEVLFPLCSHHNGIKSITNWHQGASPSSVQDQTDIFLTETYSKISWQNQIQKRNSCIYVR